MNKSKYEYEYLPIDRHIVLNDNDADLFPIRIDQLDVLKRTFRSYGLKEPSKFPKFRYVENYGLPAKDQYFKREVIPDGLINLEKSIRKELMKEKRLTDIRREIMVIDMFWERLDDHQTKYKHEIEWLELMWYKRLFGIFVFINGRATYLTGANWWYLNWWTLDGEFPEYRDRDRRFFIGEKFAELDTTTFKNIDPKTRKPISNKMGEYEMIDLGHRICLGTNRPKARRVGDTSKVQSENTEFATRTEEAHAGIQGREESHALKVFRENFMHPYNALPVFWKPLWDTALGLRPKEHMLFEGTEPDISLHTRITHAMSADCEQYNGDKLHRYHRDEAGNVAGEDVNKGHKVIKHCLMLGDKIIGFMSMTTTVQEISEKSAGENYMNLCMDSQYESRDDAGNTASGMFNFFLPGGDGMEGYVGPYGESIIDDPTPQQAKFIGRNHGSRHEINIKLQEFKRKKDWEGMAIYQRQYPQVFRDCFSPPAKNQFFNQELLKNRIQFLTFSARELLPRRGNLIRETYPDGNVRWMDDPENGRFYKSYEFTSLETNRRHKDQGVWYPDLPEKCISSSDTFGLDRTLGRASKGGGAVKLRRDFKIDPPDKDISLCDTDRLIMTYCFRPETVEEYCEDMLNMSVYCSCMHYPERNKDNVVKHFQRRGYAGYLLHDIDRNNGHPKPEPGWWNKDEIKIIIFNIIRDTVLKEATRCVHVDWMQECVDIRDPKDMTNFDLFTARAGCELAERNPFFSMIKQDEGGLDVMAMMETYEY